MHWNGFNFNNNNKNDCNCPKCRNVQDVEYLELDVEIEDPEDILEDYFWLIRDVQSEEELYHLLANFYKDVVFNISKTILLDEIGMKIDLLNYLKYRSEF